MFLPEVVSLERTCSLGVIKNKQKVLDSSNNWSRKTMNQIRAVIRTLVSYAVCIYKIMHQLTPPTFNPLQTYSTLYYNPHYTPIHPYTTLPSTLSHPPSLAPSSLLPSFHLSILPSFPLLIYSLHSSPYSTTTPNTDVTHGPTLHNPQLTL